MIPAATLRHLVAGLTAAVPDFRNAAHRDASQDRHGPGDLPETSRITEDDHAGERADNGFDVHKGAGHLGRHPALPVGEQRE